MFSRLRLAKIRSISEMMDSFHKHKREERYTQQDYDGHSSAVRMILPGDYREAQKLRNLVLVKLGNEGKDVTSTLTI